MNNFLEKIGSILRWFFGSLFAVFGVVAIIKSPGVSSILVLISSLLLIPYIEKLIGQKVKIDRMRYIPIVVIVLSFSIIAVFIVNSSKSKVDDNVNYLPGMKEYDLAGNLIDKGFKCKFTPGDLQDEHRCTLSKSDHEVTVEIFGNYSNIRTVDAVVLNYSKRSNASVARPYLGFIGSIPYDGSTPAEARSWVEHNLTKKKAEKVFQNIKFSIFGKARARFLRISAIQPKVIDQTQK